MEVNIIIVLILFSIVTIACLAIYMQQHGFRIRNATNELIVAQNPDSVIFDAFGRQRVSNNIIIFDSKQLHDDQSLLWDTSSSNMTAVFNKSRASTIVTSTANTAGSYIKQTYRWFDYRPGKSQLILMTGVIKKSSGSWPGVTVRIGQFTGTTDSINGNGLFFEYSNNKMHVVVRNNGSDTKIAQENWNIDIMDGKGISGNKTDWSKIQIFIIDYGWLGADRVRFCLFIHGVLHPVHYYMASNVIEGVFISTPNNPLRFEVITTSESPQIETEQICAAVSTEGDGYYDAGIIRTIPSDNDMLVNNETNKYVLQAFRLKSEFFNKTIIPINVNVFNFTNTNNRPCEWQLVHGCSLSTIPSFTPVDNSAIESYNAPETAQTIFATGGMVIASGYADSSRAGSIESLSEILTKNLITPGTCIDGTKQFLAVVAQSMAGSNSVNLRSSFTYKEL